MTHTLGRGKADTRQRCMQVARDGSHTRMHASATHLASLLRSACAVSRWQPHPHNPMIPRALGARRRVKSCVRASGPRKRFAV